MSKTPSNNSINSMGSYTTSSLPASILEKSKISLIIDSNDSALDFTVSVKSFCSADNEVSNNKPVMPITPFIGVRISWLILAKNSDFNLADARA